MWPRFSTPFAFDVLWFRNETTYSYRKSKTSTCCADDCLMFRLKIKQKTPFIRDFLNDFLLINVLE